MVHSLEVGVTLAVVLGILAQWVAWRFSFPVITLLALAGLMLGPVTGLLVPAEAFGSVFESLVGLSVAVILFEGGFSLRTHEIKGNTGGVLRLITLGVLISWLLGTLAAHFVAGLAWPLAVILGAILVVTGPTVVGPLLRQARLRPQAASLFKWEGIINDPLGALLAILSYEYVIGTGSGLTLWDLSGWLFVVLALAGILGGGAGWLLGWLYRTGWVPEFLKAPALLAAVLLVYTSANGLQSEAGLLATTAMGLVLGNMELASALDLRRFKENIVVFLVTLLFVLLTADIEPATLARLDWWSAAFVGLMMAAVRPIAILLATLRSSIPIRERVLLGWIAPRGVVAAAVAGILGQDLAQSGVAQAELLFPLTFAVILTTVIVHGATFRPLAEWLGLTGSRTSGLLIVGAGPWTIQLAQRLHESGLNVLLADRSEYRLSPAESVGIPTYTGEILSDLGQQRLDLSSISHLLAATDNTAYNTLVCTRFAPELGREQIYQLPAGTGVDSEVSDFSHTLRGLTAFSQDATYDEMTRRYYMGWHFHEEVVRPASSGALSRGRIPRAECPEGGDPILLLRRDGGLAFYSPGWRPEPRPGDRLLCYVPPASEEVEEAPDESPEEAAGASTRE